MPRAPERLGSALAAGPLTDEIVLRDANAPDREILFAWYEQGYRAHIETLWGWDEAWQRRDFAQLFAALPPAVVLQADRAVGYVQTQQRPDALHLANIVIRPAAQGQGIGSTILRELQQRAAARRWPVTLKVFRSNARALAFYRRHGFEVVAYSETHHRMRWAPGAPMPGE